MAEKEDNNGIVIQVMSCDMDIVIDPIVIQISLNIYYTRIEIPDSKKNVALQLVSENYTYGHDMSTNT